MENNFDHHAWKLNHLQEEIRKEIETYIDGIVPLVKKIDFTYTDYGRLYKIQVYDENREEITIKDEDDYRGERRFDSDDIRHVAKKLGIQVDNNFGGRKGAPRLRKIQYNIATIQYSTVQCSHIDTVTNNNLGLVRHRKIVAVYAIK